MVSRIHLFGVLLCAAAAPALGSGESGGVQAAGSVISTGAALYGAAGGPVGTNFRVSSVAEHQVEAAVAFGSQRGEYLVVWRNDWPGNDDLYGQRLTGDGQPIGGWFAVSAGAGAERRWPRLDYNSRHDEFLVVWEHEDGTRPSIRGRIVSATGQLLGSELSIASGGAALASRLKPAVAYAYTSNHYVVAWERHIQGAISNDIEVQALTRAGVPDGASFLIAQGTLTEGHERPDLAYNRGRNELLVVWQQLSGNTADVYGRVVKLTGGPGTLGQAFQISFWQNEETEPAVAALPTPAGIGLYLVAFTTKIDGVGCIHVQGVSGAGALVGSRRQVGGTDLPTGPEPDLHGPALASDTSSGQFLVAWSHSSAQIAEVLVRGRLVTGAASVLDPEIGLGGIVAGRVAVAGGAPGGYLVVFDDHPPLENDRDIYGQLWGGSVPTPTATATTTPEPTTPATPTASVTPGLTPGVTATATGTPELTPGVTPTSPPTGTESSTPVVTLTPPVEPTLPSDCLELLLNGDFETGSLPPEWDVHGAVSMGPGYESDHGVLLGGHDNAGGELWQVVAIPEGSAPVRLRFWWLVEGMSEQPADAVEVLVQSAEKADPIGTLRAIAPFGHWRREWFDLTDYSGQTVAVTFLVHTDDEEPSSFVVDDVSLMACGPASATASVTPTSEPTITATGGVPPSATPSATATASGAPSRAPSATGTVPATLATPSAMYSVLLPIALLSHDPPGAP